MPTKVTIELNHEGIQELLTSEPIAAECKKAAEAIQSRAGEGFEVVGPQVLGRAKRAGYGVAAATYAAKKAEAENGTLSKAVR